MSLKSFVSQPDLNLFVIYQRSFYILFSHTVKESNFYYVIIIPKLKAKIICRDNFKYNKLAQ